jgi:ubiquitin carboxyl-terminal hydrolase 6/32
MHEDVNQISKKPYVEQKDSNGRPDEEVAQEFWEGFKARE